MQGLKLEGREDMGKGDKRSFRGKLFKGSHGKTRPGRPKRTPTKPGRKTS